MENWLAEGGGELSAEGLVSCLVKEVRRQPVKTCIPIIHGRSRHHVISAIDCFYSQHTSLTPRAPRAICGVLI